MGLRAKIRKQGDIKMRLSERRALRQRTERNLRTKYRNLFLNEFKFLGLDYGVADFFMKKILFLGRVAAFNLETGSEEIKQLGFGTFTPRQWDWKGAPIKVEILNEWRSPLIPKRNLQNDEEAVILDLGFIPNDFIIEYTARLLDIRATIETNIIVNKMPFVIKSTDKKTVQAIQDLLRNEPFIWTDDNQFEILPTQVPYVIDKLYLHYQEVENELLSVLGIDGIKFEKKAQMSKDEINANDDEIDAYRKTIRQRLEAFFEQVNTVLGHSISIEEDKDEIFEHEEEDDFDA